MANNVNARRIARNTLMLYVRMLLIMVVNIYMSRVVLKALGVEDYGVYSVVSGAIAFLGFFNSSLSMATQRFLNVELGKHGVGNLKKVFNMSINIHVLVGLVVVILAETVGLWLVSNLKIPIERQVAAQWAYQCVIVSTFFTIVQVPFNSAVYAYEKMDVYAYLSIFDVFLRLALTYLLVLYPYDKLILYGLLMCCVHILIFLIYSFYVTRKLDACKIECIWDKKIFKSIAGFLGWNVCGQVAQVLTTHGVNMVANLFFGVIINAAISITNQVNGAISLFVQNFQVSFRPQIMKSYAADQKDEMSSLVYKASKSSFYLLFVISIPIMLNIDYILDIWLDTVPAYSSIFCKLLIWYSFFEAMGLPLVIAIMATGNNKYYQIFVSIVISLNIILVWFFFKYGYPPEYIYYIKIAISFLVIAVRLFFADKQTSLSAKGFMRQSVLPALMVLVIIIPIYYLLGTQIDNIQIFNRIALTFLFELFIISVIYRVGLSRSERNFIINLLRNKIRKSI